MTDDLIDLGDILAGLKHDVLDDDRPDALDYDQRLADDVARDLARGGDGHDE